MELQVEEHRQAEIGDPAHAVGAVAAEEFEAQLDAAHMGAHGRSPGGGLIHIRRVERDKYRIGG